jgi:hypothetical protein
MFRRAPKPRALGATPRRLNPTARRRTHLCDETRLYACERTGKRYGKMDGWEKVMSDELQVQSCKFKVRRRLPLTLNLQPGTLNLSFILPHSSFN